MAAADPLVEWFYTAPVDATAVRRGDPLGLRAYAEEMAEALAPGLSNRTVDGRWLSIMCWALEQAHGAWSVLGAAGDEGVGTRDAAKELYSWLRPLELLWLARTVRKTSDRGKGRQLPGVRAVRDWTAGVGSSERFGFAASSYARYRSAGVYGAYRVALRSLPGITVGGDGWQLGHLGRELARVVHHEVRCDRDHRLRRGRRPSAESYWCRRFAWERGRSDFLPTLLGEPRRMPIAERALLRRALFSKEGSETERRDGVRRRAVVEAASGSSATTRPALFADIVRALGQGRPLEELVLLSPFCELADAGVAAMNACWAVVREGSGSGFAVAADALARGRVVYAMDTLAAASQRWQRDGKKGSRRVHVADALAEGVVAAGRNRTRQFQALERHHNQFGGGLKWLALEGDMLKPLAPLRGGDASEYRFRIGALTRMGVQAGVIGAIPKALRDHQELDDDDNGEGDG